MLTKDLLRYRIKKGNIYPLFLKVEDQKTLVLADQLINIYKNSIGKIKREITDLIEMVVGTNKNKKVVKGLNKVILDNTIFEKDISSEEATHLRKELFSFSFFLLSKNYLTYKEYKEKIYNRLDPLFVKEIYCDLPEKEKLIKLKRDFTPVSLIKHYNTSLIQGLLLFAKNIKIKNLDREYTHIRGILRYIKFFRLIASISKSKKKSGASSEIIISVDGPASVIEQSKKYGFQLASFFPVIISLNKWKMLAELEISKRNLLLTVDHSAPLISHYHFVNTYIPEEIIIFKNEIEKISSDWSIITEGEFLNCEEGEIVIPDIVLLNKIDGEKRYIEIFHKWHRLKLTDRIKLSKRNNNYIIGIDRDILKDRDIYELIYKELNEGKNFFIFKNFPSAKKVISIISKSSKNG